VLCDATRPGHEIRYHPGETNLRLADVVVINKEDSAEAGAVDEIVANVERVKPEAEVIHAESRVSVAEDDGDRIAGATVLVVEDGPTLTHGGATHGAGLIAAEQEGAGAILDGREHAVGSIADVLDRYPQIDRVLPAMGYSDAQLRDLERSIANAPCDVVVSGTPFDLARQVDVDVPIVRVRYDLAERGRGLDEVLDERADALGLPAP
jgi:predicted GTPase